MFLANQDSQANLPSFDVFLITFSKCRSEKRKVTQEQYHIHDRLVIVNYKLPELNIMQMIQENQLPLIPDWKSSEYPLCTVSIEKNKSIEDSGSRTLQVTLFLWYASNDFFNQVDFAASHIGGGVLGGGRVQEEIRFCICPELLVSMLIMDSMASNEAIIISGYERFSCYEGYAGTLKYAGSYQDPSEVNEQKYRICFKDPFAFNRKTFLVTSTRLLSPLTHSTFKGSSKLRSNIVKMWFFAN